MSIDSFDPLAGLHNEVFLWQERCIDDRCTLAEFSGGPATNVTFVQIPEPGTLALILGGFGVGWLVRKRKVAA